MNAALDLSVWHFAYSVLCAALILQLIALGTR
jgi:hypothetical protein